MQSHRMLWGTLHPSQTDWHQNGLGWVWPRLADRQTHTQLLSHSPSSVQQGKKMGWKSSWISIKIGVSQTDYHHGQKGHGLLKINLSVTNRNEEWLEKKIEAKKAFPFIPSTLHFWLYLLPPKKCKAVRNKDCHQLIAFSLTFLSPHTSFLLQQRPFPWATVPQISPCQCGPSPWATAPDWEWAPTQTPLPTPKYSSYQNISHTKMKVMPSHQQKWPIYKHNKTPVVGHSRHCDNKIFLTIIPLFWVFPVQVLSTASPSCYLYLKSLTRSFLFLTGGKKQIQVASSCSF